MNEAEETSEITPHVVYVWQLNRADHGWTDIASGESYADMAFCGINPIKGRVRLVRRTTTDEVVPL